MRSWGMPAARIEEWSGISDSGSIGALEVSTSSTEEGNRATICTRVNATTPTTSAGWTRFLSQVLSFRGRNPDGGSTDFNLAFFARRAQGSLPEHISQVEAAVPLLELPVVWPGHGSGKVRKPQAGPFAACPG